MVSAATWTVTICRAWIRPRAIFCPATMITPVLLATRWAVTGSVEGRGGGPAGRAPRSSRAWSQVSGLGRVREQDPGGGVEEHQRVSARSGCDTGGRRGSPRRAVAAAQADVAVLADRAVDLDRGAGLGRGERRRPGGTAAAGGQRGPGPRRTGASGRDLTGPRRCVRWITSVLAQNVTIIPARAGPSQNCLPSDLHVPAGRHRPVELHRPAAIADRAGCPGPPALAGSGCRLRRVSGRGRDRGQGQDGGQPQRQQLPLGLGAGGAEPVRRDGHARAPDAAGSVLYSLHPARPPRPARRPGPRTGPRRRAARGAACRWNRSIFPVVVGEPGLGQPVGDAVVPADPVEQHLPALAEPVGELLAIVGEHLLRAPRTRAAPRRTPGTPPGRSPGPPPRRSRSTGNGHRPRSRPWPRSRRPGTTPPTMSSCHSAIGASRSHRR